MSETSVTRLTASGRSAVAVIGLQGPRAAEFVAACFCGATTSPFQDGQIRYGTWQQAGGAAVESVVLTPLSDDYFEIHGHGGVAAVSRIIDSLVDLGASHVTMNQWDESLANAAGETWEPLIGEAEDVLIRCTTRASAAIALQQSRGAFLAWVIDWSDRIAADVDSLDALKIAASEVLARRSLGRHLTVPYRVVLAGPPNVGKSSLVNAIVGYGRSITHDEAGTTRDVVDCDTVISGVAIRLGDTAGIRTGGGVIEREGIRRGSLAIAAADMVIIVVDPRSFSEHTAIEQTVRELNCEATTLLVLNKADRLNEELMIAEHSLPSNMLRTVATEEIGINEVALAMVSQLCPERLSQSGIEMPVPINARQVRWLEAIASARTAAVALESLTALRRGQS
jgi:tRNA modification GTPase